MVRERRKSNTKYLLVLFLMSIALFAVTSLYLEQRNSMALLNAQIQELQKNQVLLMVPEEHSQALAKWMQDNPNATELLLEQVNPGSEARVAIGPGVTEVKHADHEVETEAKTIDETEVAYPARVAPQVVEQQLSEPVEQKPATKDSVTAESGTTTLSEDDKGVKVISLPHGGIRITTREDN